MTARKYLRFYYPEFQRDYRAIYEDDGAFATFIRLLARAEADWPGTPELPRTVRARSLAKLVAAGLVVVTGSTFELKGFVKERTNRAQSARIGAAQRWQSDGNANA